MPNNKNKDINIQTLIKTAENLGVTPEELASVIALESGFDPNIWGGDGGNYYGLIQFGPNERKALGIDPNRKYTIAQQMPFVEKFLTSRGFHGSAYSNPRERQARLYNTILGGNPNANMNNKDAFGTSVNSVVSRMLPGGDLRSRAKQYLGITGSDESEKLLAEADAISEKKRAVKKKQAQLQYAQQLAAHYQQQQMMQQQAQMQDTQAQVELEKAAMKNEADIAKEQIKSAVDPATLKGSATNTPAPENETMVGVEPPSDSALNYIDPGIFGNNSNTVQQRSAANVDIEPVAGTNVDNLINKLSEKMPYLTKLPEGTQDVSFAQQGIVPGITEPPIQTIQDPLNYISTADPVQELQRIQYQQR